VPKFWPVATADYTEVGIRPHRRLMAIAARENAPRDCSNARRGRRWPAGVIKMLESPDTALEQEGGSITSAFSAAVSLHSERNFFLPPFLNPLGVGVFLGGGVFSSSNIRASRRCAASRPSFPPRLGFGLGRLGFGPSLWRATRCHEQKGKRRFFIARGIFSSWGTSD